MYPERSRGLEQLSEGANAATTHKRRSFLDVERLPHVAGVTTATGWFCYVTGLPLTLRGVLECAGHLLVKVVDVAKNLSVSVIPASA